MKTTIDIPDVIYRQVKVRSATEGRAVREVAISLFSAWLADTTVLPPTDKPAALSVLDQPLPPWFGSLHKYAANANGQFDMASVRRSIARGRREEEKLPS